MRERDVESYLKDRVEGHGGEVRKLQWIGRRGAPDRVAFLGGAHFIELKRPGETPEPHQEREHRRLRNCGASVFVLDCYEAVDRFIGEVAWWLT